jgi:hypothetical protein
MASRRDAISRFALVPGVSRHVRLLGSEGEQCARYAITITGVSPVAGTRSKSSNLVAATDQEFDSCNCAISFPRPNSCIRKRVSQHDSIFSDRYSCFPLVE